MDVSLDVFNTLDVGIDVKTASSDAIVEAVVSHNSEALGLTSDELVVHVVPLEVGSVSRSLTNSDGEGSALHRLALDGRDERVGASLGDGGVRDLIGTVALIFNLALHGGASLLVLKGRSNSSATLNALVLVLIVAANVEGIGFAGNSLNKTITRGNG